MSFHRFSEQKSIWNLSVKQLILLALFGSSVYAIQAFKKALPKQSFCNAWWTWFVQTALVATECWAARRILKRRATLLAGVTQPVRGNLGFKVIAHDLILNMNLKKTLRLFWVGFCYYAQHAVVKTRYRADLIPACFTQMGPAGLKNWATKNLWGVLIKSGWWFLLSTHWSYWYSYVRDRHLLICDKLFIPNWRTLWN
jgi:hypothetical protein